MPLFDTHAHLEDEQLQSDLAEFLRLAQQADVTGINSIGTTYATSVRSVELAEKHAMIYASVGVHPNYTHQATTADWDALLALVDHPKVVGIGETGLDRHWDYAPLATQQEWFERHIELAIAKQKPLVIHMRESEREVLDMVRAHQSQGPIPGILHSFAGSWETAKECLDWGMYVSFSGIVTYKKAESLRQIALRVPTDRLLIETDAPYLSPHPHRGQRPNHPAMVLHTAECLASLLRISLEEFGQLTTTNAQQVFGLSLG